MRSLLIIEDSSYASMILEDIFKELGFEYIVISNTGEEAIDLAFEMEPDLITLDNILPDMLGIHILEVFKEENLKSNIIMISAVKQNSVIAAAHGLGVEYITKPFTKDDIKSALKKLKFK